MWSPSSFEMAIQTPQTNDDLYHVLLTFNSLICTLSARWRFKHQFNNLTLYQLERLYQLENILAVYFLRNWAIYIYIYILIIIINTKLLHHLSLRHRTSSSGSLYL